MREFTDTTGRKWRIALTLGSAMQVKSALEVDLLAPEAGDPPLLTRLATDEFLLGKVILCLLSGQFEACQMTEADVLASFDGATLLAAQEAFFGDLTDFFQSRGRLDRAAAVRKQSALMQAAIQQATAEVQAITLTHGGRSGESPA